MTRRSDAEIVADYEAKVMSGEVFRLAANGVRSIIGSQPPVGYRDYAEMLTVLAQGALLSDRQTALVAPIVAAIAGAPAWYPKEAVGKMYETAAQHLDESVFFDVVRAASPEPGRRSDCESDWTLADRLTLLVTLHKAKCKAIPDTGIGWCLSALIERERVRTI